MAKTKSESNRGGPRPGSGAPKVVEDATRVSFNLPGDLAQWINDSAPARGRSAFVAGIIRAAKKQAEQGGQVAAPVVPGIGADEMRELVVASQLPMDRKRGRQ
jgi:hypothetical protein